MAHTPGPWEFVRYEAERDDGEPGQWSGYHIKEPESGCTDVAYVDDVDYGPKIATANARLIAAAPELLECCQNALGAYEAIRLLGADKALLGFESCLADLKAAIKKARSPRP